MFISGLDSELHILSIHMNFVGRSIKELTHYIKRVEGVKREGQAKELSKRANSYGNFQGSYTRGSGRVALRPSQFSLPCPPLLVTIWELLLICFLLIRVLGTLWEIDHQEAALALCEELVHVMRNFPQSRSFEYGHQPCQTILPM